MSESGSDTGEFGETLTKLSEYIIDLEYDDIPSKVVERENKHIIDTIGCILYGTSTSWVKKVIAVSEHLGESGDTSVLGSDYSATPARAVLTNGTASHSMDFDDHCQEAGIHAGSATVPAALAYAENTDEPVSGEEFITAVTAGVEVGIRSGFGIGYGSVSQGWHIAGWTGAFAAATTAGKLYDLDHSQLSHALAIAGTQGCGLLGAQYGAEVKRFHMGKAAEAGYLAAALAGELFTGDSRIFQDRYGAIGSTMSNDYDIDAVTSKLGERYRIMDKLSLKPFPSIGQIHAPVDALKQLLDNHEIVGDEVDEVTVHATPTVKHHVGWEYEPADVMSAQANIQYAIASLLVDGEITVDTYTDDAIRRPVILDRISDISVAVDEGMEKTTFGSIVEVTAGNVTVENAVHTPRGCPSNFMTEDEIRNKFFNQSERSVGEDNAEEIVEIISNAEQKDDITTLLHHC
jgi:2-methylcitrate dehydratase PrpD